VVIAVVAVRVVKTAIDQVIDMIAMRHGLVSAARAVHVARFMAGAPCRTLIRIFCADLDLVFVYMVAVWVMQMTIVQIVYVIPMPYCGVSAARAMLMVMVGVMGACEAKNDVAFAARTRGGALANVSVGH
jgi:hypothetical protein